MPKASIAKLVLYTELGNTWPALITKSYDTPEITCNLTVFGLQGQSYRKANYSDEQIDLHWTWMPQGTKK